MGFLIGLFTFVMILDCIILVFLVLIQLPKKDAGAGLAFGASATDALFGAGSGTVLTKITKYAASAFFAMAIILSVMQSSYHKRAGTLLGEQLERPGSSPIAVPQTDSSAMPSVPSTNSATNAIVLPTNSPASSTAPK